MSVDPLHRVVPASRRRDKPILSCVLCRKRKLKCDRQQPCKTCVDRGLSFSCTYAPHVPSPAHEPKPNNVHDRIDQLEKLVTTLMGSNNPNSSEKSEFSELLSSVREQPSTYSNHPGLGAPETVKLDSDATSYTNSNHWSSILDGISELREELDKIPTSAQPRDPYLQEIRGPDLLFGQQRHASRNDILAAVPTKSEADRLLATYFLSMEMQPTIIHRPTFQREYDAFWERPSETPVMWIGLLFSLFALASRFHDVLELDSKDAEDTKDLAMRAAKLDFYREKLVQCLILANYTKCPPYTIETFLQYFVTEYFRSQDTQFSTWMLVGMIVRVAFRMGYHREPSRFTNISVFEAEMRRRTWALIVQLDLMSSVQLGLPRAIQASMQDVMEPRNLKDEDLDENMTELPPSRPTTETTQVLYTLVRNRVQAVFARIVDLTSSAKQPAYPDVMELDAALRAVYDELPPSMKAIRAKDIQHEDAGVIMRRLYMGLNFFKAQIILHRPFHLLGRVDPRYRYSRSSCVGAALELLELQKVIDADTRPGRRLFAGRYRVWSISWRLSAIVNHDFLLATTIVSLDLDKDIASPMALPDETAAGHARFRCGQPTRAEIVEALKNVFAIWVQYSDRSREAKKVAAAVKLVLTKAGALEQDTDNSPAETPMSQFDFSSFPKPDPHMEFTEPTFDSTFFDLQNPHLVSPYPNADVLMDMSGFDWGGLDTPSFEPNLQNQYMG